MVGPFPYIGTFSHGRGTHALEKSQILTAFRSSAGKGGSPARKGQPKPVRRHRVLSVKLYEFGNNRACTIFINSHGKGVNTIRIAHFSDFHIHTAQELDRALKLVRHAISQGTDHIVITGDLVDAAEVRFVEQFWLGLKHLGWDPWDRVTYTLGNHDVFPLPGRLIPDKDNLPEFTRPTSNATQVLEITESSRIGDGCFPLVEGEEYPVGKILTSDVVIAALDTTRHGRYNPRRWGEGELPKSHMRAVDRFFELYPHVRHRIIAMHHTPWHEDLVGDRWLPQNFADPEPEAMMRWLERSGATFCLCGHIHCVRDIAKRRFGEHGLILRAGTAGGNHEDRGPDDRVRAYHIVDLPGKGRRNIRRVTFTGRQLDAMESVQRASRRRSRL
jgi:3',5'-cyclic AMP phosphodiesterase CpdA